MLTIDGSNGAGKTTAIEAIKTHLSSKGVKYIVTREPGGTPLGEKIRELLLDNENKGMFDVAELLLFAAARAQHLHEKILPALKQNFVILSDRFAGASVAFQGHGRGIDLKLIKQVQDISLGDFQPDLNIILDLDPIIGLERVKSRGSKLDRMEDEKIDFLTKTRNGYLKQAEEAPDLFEVIDASQPQNQVVHDVLSVIDSMLKEIEA